MPQLVGRFSALVLACLLIWTGAEAQQPAPVPTTGVNGDAKVLEDFRTRVDAYLEIQQRLAKDSPPLEETSNPADIAAAQEVLAAKIRSVRKDARPGNIFTPEIRTVFRRLMYPELQGKEGRETKATITDDAPVGVTLKVNAAYPTTQALPTVPANLLARLPQLPEQLEYRIVGRDLILRDVDANIIVDFIPKAIR
jgi:hypothetical protein